MRSWLEKNCILLCTLAIVFLLLWQSRFLDIYRGLLRRNDLSALNSKPAAASPRNNITYVYVVGVEGVGHHGIVPALVKLGQSCGRHVVFEHKLLRKHQQAHDQPKFHSLLRVSKFAKAPKPLVLVVEDASFPSGGNLRYADHETIKSNGLYDLEWIHDQIADVGDIKTKFLFLSRDFYRAVASHPEFDNGFEQHAQVLHNYITYIFKEYQRIEAKSPHSWGQVKYEWFTEMRNCSALVAELASFLLLDNCNVEEACGKLRKVVRKERQIVINATEVAIARRYDASLPIPFLPYQP